MSKWLTGFLCVLLFSFALMSSHAAMAAAEVTVFSVNKTLSLGPKDPVYRDYYLNGGLEVGFRRGMLVTVVRRVPVHDLSRNRSLGDLRVPVARLKLIYVNKILSVGRVEKIVQPINLPATEFASVMVGDLITLGDGLEDLGRMDDLEGDGAKGSGNQGEVSEKPLDKTGENTKSDNKIESTAEVAAVKQETPETAIKPAAIQPEKNAEKPDLNTQQAPPEAPKKSSAKATEEGKKPLKSPAKPDKSAEHAVVSPAA